VVAVKNPRAETAPLPKTAAPVAILRSLKPLKPVLCCLRLGKANLAHSFATVRDGEGYLMNADIPEYVAGNRHNHKATQPRKLLLHRRELNKLMAAVQRDGMTIVPLKLYFNEHGRAKLLLGLARGRKKGDKRDVEKKRDWQRQKARLLK
jgi:SsrA-binding protein